VPVSSVFSSQKHSHFAFFSFSLPQTKYLPGKTLIMNYGHNYFHAMIDALPTLYFAELAGYKLDEIDHFIFTGFSKEIYYAIFKRVGIPEHKIIVINHVVNYECEELLVGTVFERHGDWYKDYVVKKLGIQLTENKHHFPKRIYVSRAKAKMRKVINEDDVAEFLKGYGFEIVYNEGLSLEQQAEMYYNAEYIISAHGANLVNILYCKPGTHLCEIRYRKHTRYYSKVYFQMANAFKMKYYLLYCDEGRLSENYEGNEIEAESDMLVNLKHLEQIIKEMGLGSK
jgi:capsular polysaccharide biosynthesis protein